MTRTLTRTMTMTRLSVGFDWSGLFTTIQGRKILTNSYFDFSNSDYFLIDYSTILINHSTIIITENLNETYSVYSLGSPFTMS